MISEEGQQILVKRDFVPTNKKISSPLGTLPMKLVDAALVLNEEKKWIQLYHEIIVKQGK
jgi:iron(III) transport system substrate-binding protein